MRNENTIETTNTVSIDQSKLLGFAHLTMDMADEAFAEEAAASFNKIAAETGENSPVI